ncbi:unnamed protein product [Angiostrongylus costaricensis]|uniref:HA domain-containing protein n=1 Tax=Angiostrongylus costaricensis TaxID=334426 RepID=A0A158PIA3_ANGCS|nr:unnamed protein product [Angiostrongylus costaricensis]
MQLLQNFESVFAAMTQFRMLVLSSTSYHKRVSHTVLMITMCSPPPHSTPPGDPLGVNFGIMNQISVSSLSSHDNDNMDNVLQSQSPGLELAIGEITVASAVASEKARVRQQSAMLDKWLMANGGNLYPCREDKEKLAALMKMTYLQAVPSPVSVTPASFSQDHSSRPNTPASKENVMTQLPSDVISAFAQAFAAQQPETDEKMVVQQQQQHQHLQQNHTQPQQREHAITPPAIEDHHPHHLNGTSTTQVMADMHSTMVPPLNAHEMAAKMLANASLPANSNALAQYNPLLLAMLQPLALQQLLQAQALQQQYMLQHQALAQQQMEAQALWASSSISASPAHASDSEVSEVSELSPVPQTGMTMRPHSPPFKDPHQLADKSLLRLLNLNQLSEKEQMAVAVLAGHRDNPKLNTGSPSISCIALAFYNQRLFLLSNFPLDGEVPKKYGKNYLKPNPNSAHVIEGEAPETDDENDVDGSSTSSTQQDDAAMPPQ